MFCMITFSSILCCKRKFSIALQHQVQSRFKFKCKRRRVWLILQLKQYQGTLSMSYYVIYFVVFL